MPVPFIQLVAAMAVIALGAGFQGIVGIGFSVLSVPILLLIDPVLAPVPNMLLSVPLVVSQLVRERSSIDRSGVGWVLAGRLPGGLLGLWLLASLSPRALNVTLAALILIAVAILARGVAIERTRTTEVVAGVFSGVSAIVGAIGGPPVGLLYRNDPPPMVRSTLGVIFAFGLVISIALRAAGGKITTTDLRITLWLLPAMFIGFAASNRFKNRIDGPRLRAWILAVSALAAVTLVVRTLTG